MKIYGAHLEELGALAFLENVQIIKKKVNEVEYNQLALSKK